MAWFMEQFDEQWTCDVQGLEVDVFFVVNAKNTEMKK